MARISIEDCLDTMENRFALVKVAVDRTRSLMEGAPPLLKSRNKEGVTALREIAEGLIISKNVKPAAPVASTQDLFTAPKSSET